jgi:hypothetical protein
VAEDEDLHFLRSAWSRQQPHERKQVAENEIHERPEQAASLDDDQERPNLATPETFGRAAYEFANPTG